MMRQTGIGWVRSDFDWNAVERKKGEWNFDYFDRVVSECESAGVQLLPILKGHRDSLVHGLLLDEWGEFVRRVVERYGRRLPVLEVWNEQNADGFNPTNYLAVLRRAYETVKKADPSVRVAFGGTAGVPLDFIEGVYKAGGAKWFDIMNIHPYTHPRRPEGVMDEQMEKLRDLMARCGDAEKPLWVTEIGWPTHRFWIGDYGLMAAGLKVARPEVGEWRVLYVPATGGEYGDDEQIALLLRGMVPKGSSVEVCRPARLQERLAKGGVDAIVYPFSEDYASDSVDAVHAFVKAGGVLVDFGGCPMHNAFRSVAEDMMMPDKKAESWRDRERFRISVVAWWMDNRYPETMPVAPTSVAPGIEVPQGGLTGSRFFRGNLLKGGDRIVPLLSATTNGVEAVTAAVYKFDSDMKGAVVVSGLVGVNNLGTSSEERQANMMARSFGIAFAEGVENCFWYEFRQLDVDPVDHESYFGIVHDNFAPKPAYGAYMTFAAARPSGSVNKSCKWRSDDGRFYFLQWTRPDGVMAGMVWTVGDACDRKVLFTSDKMTFLDVAGARVRPEREGNVYALRVSESPLYFFGGELDGVP